MVSKDKFDFLYQYDYPINWNLSGFGNEIHMFFIDRLIGFLAQYNIKPPIHTIHGSYLCKYCGGRVAMYVQKNQKIYDKIRSYNNQGIGVKLTFTNLEFTKDMFEEQELNEYLEVLSENKGLGNGIICVSDELSDYIHQKYPNVETTCSYVKMAMETQLGKTDTVDYYNSKFDKYDMVVLNTYRAFDDEFLDQIKYKNRIEFIANNTCNLNCPIAHNHYINMFKIQQRMYYLWSNRKRYQTDVEIFRIRRELDKISHNCILRKQENNLNRIKYQYINRTEINHLLSKGINNFKLEGRDLYIEELSETMYSYIVDNKSLFWIYRNIPKPEDLNEWESRKILSN